MAEYTIICMEDSSGYHDPLIYTLEFEDIRSLTEGQVFDKVVQERLEEIGDDELEEEIRARLRVCLIFEGDLYPVADWRT